MAQESINFSFKSIEEVHSAIRKCTRCPLYKLKTNYVPGEGNVEKGIVFIGEAPGAEEDKQGRPFVGRAGQYLTQTIKNILGLDRKDVYITNVLKCRPPNNRDPKPEEIKACSVWLEIQLNLIKPNIIVTLGRYSTQWIFEYFGLKFTTIMKVRGKVYNARKWNKIVYIIPTLHPAAVLYHPNWKELFEHDFGLIKNVLLNKQDRKTILDYFR